MCFHGQIIDSMESSIVATFPLKPSGDLWVNIELDLYSVLLKRWRRRGKKLVKAKGETIWPLEYTLIWNLVRRASHELHKNILCEGWYLTTLGFSVWFCHQNEGLNHILTVYKHCNKSFSKRKRIFMLSLESKSTIAFQYGCVIMKIFVHFDTIMLFCYMILPLLHKLSLFCLLFSIMN